MAGGEWQSLQLRNANTALEFLQKCTHMDLRLFRKPYKLEASLELQLSEQE